eukprot:TRINITY_DN56439_c0_g1_i1.p1 TRINITY_DN56439_c0_g1~~TRINITY_DN56439_c0_g1_i1.p1  ORF type:complete len:484 (-),score=83.60 TRINITY_DN56439_c0_g1_i1:212-1663(-)
MKLLEIKQKKQPALVAAALSHLRQLEGGIAVVVLIGDGRSGKSFLADHLAQHFGLPKGTFRSDSKQDAVTEGMDMMVIPLKPKKPEGIPAAVDEGDVNGKHDDMNGKHTDKETQVDTKEDLTSPANFVIIDCEGGTNAQAPIRQLVYVLATLMASQVVFVVGGQASEPQLQNLAATIAARQLIDVGKDAKLTSPVLHFVVNKKDPTLTDQDIEMLLNEQHDDAARNRLRASIKQEYPARRLFSIPFNTVGQFDAKWASLRDAMASAAPLTMGGTLVKGPQLVGMIELAFTQLQQHHHVTLIDVQRHVIYDGYLKPLASALLTEFKTSLPDHSEFFKKLVDKRNNITAEFAQKTRHVKHDTFKKEATDWLVTGMNEAWDVAVARNDEIGHQTLETTVERKECLVRAYKNKVGMREHGPLLGLFLGKTKDIHEDRGVYQAFSRSRTVRKNGNVEYSEWVEGGQTDREIKVWCGCYPYFKKTHHLN